MNTENENSASVLAEIEQAGEDVSDAKSIVESKESIYKGSKRESEWYAAEIKTVENKKSGDVYGFSRFGKQ